jgi:hypothetical protein
MPLPGQQLDRPVGPEDLVDIKTAAEKSYAAQTSTIDDTERALRILVGRNNHSANAEGATAQVLVLRCLNDHGFYTKLAQIYASAEQAAGKVVRDLEAHTNSAASIAQALQDLQRQLDATLRREAELRASPDPSSAEDLEEQQQIEKKLQETMAVYRAISMPGVHRIASLLKRWLLGTHQGSVTAAHLDAYLNEFAFRFNRRHSRRRGLLFLRLLQYAVVTLPTRYRPSRSRALIAKHNL